MREDVPHIICFGDSLTAGYQSPSHQTPYGAFLQQLVGDRAAVSVRGICGELTGEMGERFESDVVRHRPAYVVILGGTNDLGWEVASGEIASNLIALYERARAGGIEPVAITVPSIRLPGIESAAHIRRRLELNRLITDARTTRRMSGIDLFAATSEPDSLQLAARYSSDGLHLTTDGYRLMADLLYEQVFATACARPDRRFR